MGLLTLHSFFLTLIFFLICLVPYIHICFQYFLLLCFYFHLVSLALFATRHILQFTMFDSISQQALRNTTKIKKILHSSRRKSKCRVNNNQTKCSKISVAQSVSFSSILINLLSVWFFCRLQIKKVFVAITF